MRACLAILVAVVVAGCYEPPQDRCAIQCDHNMANACPGNLVCNTQGYCVGSAGDVCTTALASITLGAHQGCGIDAGGRLYCWGDDSLGQAGQGTGSDAVIQPATVGDPMLHWSAVAAGGDHSCAIRDGEVYCWGQNEDGESRGNAGGLQATPFKVAVSPTTPLPPMGFSQIAAGGEHSCAIGSGQLWCWGAKEAIGQDHSFMERVGTLDDWTEVSTGKTFTCGISTSMGLLCFGKNDRGQLGQIDQQDRAVPTAPANGQPPGKVPLHVAAGAGYTCAIYGAAATDAMGELWCWGENGNKEIDNTGINPIINAEMIGTVADWTHIAVGSRRACGVRAGHAYCWGNAYYGGLGNGVWNDSHAPTDAVDLGPADDVFVGMSTHDDQWDELGCLVDAGQIKCWGDNEHGDVGAGVLADMSARGVEVHAPNAHAWTHLATGHHHTCAQTDNGQTFCWGEDADGEVSGMPGRGGTSAPCIPGEPCDQPLPIIAPVPHTDKIVAGDYYACALDGSAVTCWGNNDRGTLGADGDIVRTVIAPGGETWTALMGGDRGNCGITSANHFYCWGILYNNQTLNTPTLQSDANLSPSMLDMKLGDNWDCGVRSDHQRICWGQNNNFQMGEGFQSDIATPSPSTQLPTVNAITVRNDHGCAIGDTDQHVACWGLARSSETGSMTNPAQVPTAVLTANSQMLTSCTSVSTGDTMSCAVCMGRPLCWGGNDNDQLGRAGGPSGQDPVAAFVDVPTGMMFTELSSGSDHTCAITMDGRMYCWGYGYHGELGNGGHALSIPTLLAPAR